ncbi:MFS transporter [Providencia rustigianii]|uniref:MFS transporter n=1 Tax=Providencia rustigianii TaxID=158850 RepID=UPI000F6C286B|nr:MFS transporter [Providencia rustigianii]MTC60181.1 MFS transporter [Providencia rustigianii]VEH54104.1 Inner membrane transport protein yajR [Providencia rustigianii]
MNDNKMTHLELRATWGLGSVFSLRMLGMFMVLPILTSYGMHLQGASEFLVGVAIGIYGLSQALFQIPFGLMSDKIGRKPLIIFGLLIFIIGSVVAALSDSIWGIIIGRAIQGAGAISSAVMALLSDQTREQNRTKAMAFLGISFGITFAIALVLGPIITHAVGLSGLFWGITLLAVGAILVTLFVVPNNTHHVMNRESAFVKSNLRAVLLNPQLLKLNIGILSLHTLLMSSFVALPLIMINAGYLAQDHWKAYLVTMLVAFVCVLPFIIYAEKQRKMKQVFLFCILLLAIAEIVLWRSGNNLWIIFLGIQIFFIAFNVMEAILPSLISKEAPASYKGTAMGIYSTSQFLGVAIGGILGGWLYKFEGANTVFIGGLILCAVWLLISLTMKQPPYVSSIRIVLPHRFKNVDKLQQELAGLDGVLDVVIIADEMSIYIKMDKKIITREQLEAIVQR